MKMQVTEIAKAVQASNAAQAWPDVKVTGVAFDSRKLTAGSLFVPLSGANDGHDYIQSAIDHGAVATLWAEDHAAQAPTTLPVILVPDTLVALQQLGQYYLQKINPKVVAVTGSNGKTTTKDMVASVLATQFNVTKTHANFNNQIGVPITLLSMEPNTEVVVVEMGMDHFGELDFLSQLVQPDVAVITMIGEAHIEFFGTRDKIADAKMEIVHGLKEDGTFIYNGDEPLLQERAQTIDQRQRTFGLQETNTLAASAIETSRATTSFKTNLWPETTFTIPMMGAYNVNNAMAALLVADTFHIRANVAQQALAKFVPTENRTEWLTGQHGEAILSDVYNSNPTAAKRVLAAFAATPVTGKRIAVLGDMLELGEQADTLHASLATELDPQTIQTVYLNGEHMRALAKDLATKYPATAIHYYPTHEQPQLINDLQQTVTADDEVLLKGSHGIHLENVLAALEA
ncbi:UDP-N-acetylmuramoyl-tripeptide--D-alanyl-D-alanine ligase [Lactiplantibacillus mudanjiangensis]|uniref:UDP-N-acetylmuramoyl-tripeptide--D-alanyl-D-alanine ligase n=1 Tax=Lactiplantibacillus mudanjiangensis TaxID=1296538 RepID=A0A660E023_9LACO|nr:UDP-N-acetylmuramoyl-tripeptide--D-alanyl-D-alanine ligase [Lactiplantibacillus mudanjiangensis]VDG21433.1 UDP-N-acetylmuramoyl-tripeptide--D-alanyl-D-alanine ligase [Lactobacillus sp.] [Lactiplantibacillus mudanjiangensis]VDG26115.1 UDP-N-acetylmuramoyl-tripeptide--D-alanyl-D-alanine ligase [Lactobacillus sp.] [Lactiplantibacillus mudanjiangensis]VDG29046.1 UDP-N-acetylmuramoyl-tripeptide--D-alanyl-D-alanine ligase [Lactobacillus sp.] [Lactiplantibacillus mudanjiangensis]VDG31564.1 UDP-N-ac